MKNSIDLKSLLEKGYDEILRTIREVDPPKPSTRLSTMEAEVLPVVAKKRHTAPKVLGKLLRGDLDWIVMKALEKDRSRRYDTAGAFAEDIDHFLTDRPVRWLAADGAVLEGFEILARMGNYGLYTAVLYPLPFVFFAVVFVISLLRTFFLREVSWKGRKIDIER